LPPQHAAIGNPENPRRFWVLPKWTHCRPQSRARAMDGNGVRHGFCVIFEALKNRDTPAASPRIALRSPRLAAFDPVLSGTKLREARGASRGNACLGSKSGFPQLALRASKHGLLLTGTGAGAPSKLAARRRVVWCLCDCSATCVPNRIAMDGFFHVELTLRQPAAAVVAAAGDQQPPLGHKPVKPSPERQ
jgi:hypothetical protein